MAGRPKLSEGCMRCLLLCSGCDKPSPGRGQCAILAKRTQPALLRQFARTAKRPLPARPEHPGQATHTAGESMAVAARHSPPCAKGGQHGKAMQGGLSSRVNDSAGFYCRVRKHRLGAASRCQSLSRRSPTAPFAQGRSGGRTAILSLPWLVVLAWEKRV